MTQDVSLCTLLFSNTILLLTMSLIDIQFITIFIIYLIQASIITFFDMSEAHGFLVTTLEIRIVIFCLFLVLVGVQGFAAMTNTEFFRNAIVFFIKKSPINVIEVIIFGAICDILAQSHIFFLKA